MELVRVRYWITTSLQSGTWLTTEPISYEDAQRMIDSGLYTNAHIIEVDEHE